MQALGALAARFKEPSSWAGIAVALGLVGIKADPGLVQGIEYLGAGVCCLLAFFIPETAKK